ncbi:MAG: HAMP domain-containing histidine kinase [Marinilabiliaceae bacterium]|nr:HAMP domain-containing histidine kinase [Marinilabiliaceae bacterium]
MKYMFVVLMMLLMMMMPVTVVADKPANPYRVLCLNSYHVGFSWSDEVTSGIVGYFARRDSFDIRVEHMDAKRQSHQQAEEVFYPYLLTKYKGQKFDLVVALDNSALDLVLKHKDETLFKDVLVVFGGISNPHDYPLEALDLYGVYEPDMFVESFEIIRSIYPDFDTLYYFSDRTNTGVVYRENARRTLTAYPNYRLVAVDSVYLETLPDLMKQLGGKGIVYYAGVSVDGAGHFIDDWEAARLVFENARIPVFSNYINNVSGALGGNFTKGVDHGIYCAHLIEKRLTGKHIENRINTPPLSGIYDYSKMEIYNIDPDLLPKWSRVINQPESFWVKYRKLVFWNALVIVFLVVVIVFLIRYNAMQRHAREMMAQSMDKALEADRLKGAFLANVSHELRTPLNAICGFSELLSVEALESHVGEYVDIIRTNSDLLAQLVNDLLDISLIDSNSMVIHPQPIDLEPIFEKLQTQAVSFLRIRGKEHIHVHCHTNPACRYLTNDGFRVMQVMVNFITNAVKYTESGHVEIGYDRADDRPDWVYAADARSVVLYVKDTGIGIAPEQQQMVFERFRMVDTKFVSQHGGVGLGLNIAKALVELMGGHIFVYSEPGKGSVFGFTLPAN